MHRQAHGLQLGQRACGPEHGSGAAHVHFHLSTATKEGQIRKRKLNMCIFI
jgi:hypothetical protein